MTKGLVLAMLFTLIGCAHGNMRGSVAMKASDDEAHVCMGEGEVRAGDRVTLFKNVCVGPKQARLNGDFVVGGCRKVKVGRGVVERALNEHYSLVRVDEGVQFEEGMIVEKD